MANLFIIGNGFDLAHEMKTSYRDFRNYLLEEAFLEDKDYSDDMFYDIPECLTGKDGEDVFENKEVIKAIIKSIDNLEHRMWQDVEKSLGQIEYSLFFETYGMYKGEKISHEYNRNEDNATNLYRALRQIDNYFHDWIKTIEPAAYPLKDFQNMIDKENDLFLNFNYTKTLEKVYKAKNVCHIHGCVDDEKIYLGHNNDEFDGKYYDMYCFGAKDILEKLHQNLKKDTKGAYKKNETFFKTVIEALEKSCFNIYSFGFSYSEVDEFYLEKIFKNTDTSKTCLYINKYKDNNMEKFKQTAIKCGFRGEISTFNIRPFCGLFD